MNGMAAAARVWGIATWLARAKRREKSRRVEETKGGGGIAELIRGGSGLGSCRVGPGLDLAGPRVVGRVRWVPRVSERCLCRKKRNGKRLDFL